MRRISKTLTNPLASKRLLAIVWPFLVIVVVLLVVSTQSMDVLLATRSYSEGESLWSKGQKRAIFYLLRYTETKSLADYQQYKVAVAVPKGDEKARIELLKPNPDEAIAWQGFVEGRNHPDDIERMIMLFRRFKDLWYMKEIIELWTEGDVYISQVTDVADELNARVIAGDVTEAEMRAFRERLLAIDTLLTPLTDKFSRLLGEATRITKVLLLILNLGVAGTLVPIGLYLSNRMARRRDEAESALQLSEERFNLAVAGSNDGLWDWNIDAKTVYYSPRFKQLLGFRVNEFEDTIESWMGRLHPDDIKNVRRALDAHFEQGHPFDVEMRVATKAGEYRWFRGRGQSVNDADGRAIRMAGSISDTTERQLAAAELFSEKERAQVTLSSIADGVITTDPDGWVEFLNPVAESLTGWKMSAARGLPLQAICRLTDEASRQPAANPIETVLHDQRTVEVAATLLLVRNDGVEIPIVHSGAPIRGRDGEIIGVVLILHDVSNERQYAAKLSYQATHDSLTGLINRSEFENRMTIALQSAAQLGRHHAVLYLDLDQFKIVNDTCGHTAGDQLIRQVSGLLQRRLREGDTLSRLGGDEFGVLLENCTPDNALRIAEELRQTTRDLHFAWEGRSFAVSVSIGLVSVDDGLYTLSDVLSAADAACYMAKDKGRNRVQLYRREDSEISLRHGEMEWVVRIQKALDEDRFVLYAQDIVRVDRKSQTGSHCELLVRMLDEDGKLVPPMAFIPAAERYGLMPSVDRWVLRTAFATMARLFAQPNGDALELCSINLSGATLGDDAFLEYVREQFDRFSLPRDRVCFEITETAAIANLDRAARFIEELREFGCRFSLDDFGSGMSSFGYLKHLPVDYIKIDGGFVKDMAEDPIDHAMVEAINNVGHVMGKQTIAEFVDSAKVMKALRAIGVDFAQGFWVSKPAPFEPRLKKVAVSAS